MLFPRYPLHLRTVANHLCELNKLPATCSIYHTRPFEAQIYSLFLFTARS